MENFWRKCSSCKKPIGFGEIYQKCSVSTCNQPRTGLVFCTVGCWSAHVPVYRHRDAWAEENTAPTQAAWAALGSTPAPDNAVRAPVLVRPTATPSATSMGLAKANESEVLVVVSKLKNYIRERSEMNTSADVMDKLSQILRRLCDDAIQQARTDNRKTVMARDF